MLIFLDIELLALIGERITDQVVILGAIILQTVVITGVLPINQQPAIATTDQAPLTHTKPTQNQPAIPPTLKPIQPIQDIAITIDTPIINHIVEQALATHTGAIGLQIILGTIITEDLANI